MAICPFCCYWWRSIRLKLAATTIRAFSPATSSPGVAKDGISALTNPTFVTPDEIGYLAADDVVMGLVINGEPRVYPYNIGWWNEIANDHVDGRSVVVSLCPLTGTGQGFYKV